MGRQRRPDARREATTQAIIEAAESLFGERGIDSVSLRQIGAEIGAGNTAVVAYHFGDKESLVRSILEYRLPEFERRRKQLVDEWDGEQVAAYDLLRALWLPLYEQRDGEGRRSYAAFLASLGRSRWGWVWTGAEHLVPVTLLLGERLKALMPAAAQQFFSQRAVACTALVCTGIQSLEARAPDDPGALALFEDTLRMAAAAFMAPGE